MIREAVSVVRAKLESKFDVSNPAFKRVYFVGERPPIPADENLRRAYFPYVSCSLSRRYASDTRRLSDDSSIYAFRVVTMCVGSTHGQVEYAQEKVTEALEMARLSIAGYSSTPVHYESSTLIVQDPDVEDLFVSSVEWTWVSTKQLAA